MTEPASVSLSWFVRKDIDGFFGLAIDNIVQILLIVGVCQAVLGFGTDLIYGCILLIVP